MKIKIKTSHTEKEFLMGVGFDYSTTNRCVSASALGQALRSQQRDYESEAERVVDPYNRCVVE